MIILTPVRWRAGPPRPPELASLALAGAAALAGARLVAGRLDSEEDDRAARDHGLVVLVQHACGVLAD